MWRRKKFIIIASLTVLVMGGTLGGVAIAQADDQNSNPTQTGNVTFLNRVAEIYEKNTGVAINPEELQKAFTEAGQAIKDEALDNYLQKLVKEDVITQAQADEYKAWLDARPEFMTEEFKNWLESRPSLPTDEFKQWLEERPDIPGLFGQHDRLRIGPFQDMPRGFGKFGGGFGGKFGGWCIPEAPAE